MINYLSLILSFLLLLPSYALATTNQCMRYPSGTPVNCVDSSGGSPGGSSGNLQTNNGSGGFGAYAGSSCSAGQAATSINASGALTCSSLGAFTQTFNNSSLSAGVLSVTHSLGIKNVVIQVYDNSFHQVVPDFITLVDTNNLTVDISSWGAISGTWQLVVLSSGGNSGTSNNGGFS